MPQQRDLKKVKEVTRWMSEEWGKFKYPVLENGKVTKAIVPRLRPIIVRRRDSARRGIDAAGHQVGAKTVKDRLQVQA